MIDLLWIYVHICMLFTEAVVLVFGFASTSCMPHVDVCWYPLHHLKVSLLDPAVFLGGAVLADIMKDKSSFWVSKEEYEEDPHRALMKCGSL